MPDYFWMWYEQKGYLKLLSTQDCFESKAFLVGCCIDYLTEKGQRINSLNECNSIAEMTDYLIKGVVWTR